jgi:tetratricopeptide (TPR) repeat protein
MRISFLALLLIPVLAFSSSKEEIRAMHSTIYSLLDSDPDKAFQLSERTEKVAHDQGLILEEANSIYIQAWIFSNKRSEAGKAFILYLKALEIMKPVSNDTEESHQLYTDLLINTASLLREHFAYNEAIDYYDEALEVVNKRRNPKKLAQIYWSKSKLLGEKARFSEALQTIEMGIEEAHRSQDEEMILNTINAKGLYQVEMELFTEARESFNSIIDYNFQNKESRNKFQGIAWHNIGHAFSSEGNHKQAIEAFKKADEVKSENGINSQRFITWVDLSESYYTMGNFEMAENYGLEALEIYDELKLLPDNYRLFEILSSIAFQNENYAESRNYTERYVAENNKFLEFQHEIQNVKDQFKMELLAAGFFLEASSDKTQSMYTNLLTIISIVFTVILLAGVTGQYYARQSIRKSLQKIERDSLV